jgi:hypothetical protein
MWVSLGFFFLEVDGDLACATIDVIWFPHKFFELFVDSGCQSVRAKGKRTPEAP